MGRFRGRRRQWRDCRSQSARLVIPRKPLDRYRSISSLPVRAGGFLSKKLTRFHASSDRFDHATPTRVDPLIRCCVEQNRARIGVAGAIRTFFRQIPVALKFLNETSGCAEIRDFASLYLCNICPQKGLRGFRRGCLMLPVRNSSVLIGVRRRGASRGRPVLGGSLKSLAFMRECPKARSG
jgi:hypothetical protein